jgi:hypothetical protein
MMVNEIRKITANLPKELLERAIDETGEGVTETIRKGLKLILAQSAAAKLLDYKGKIQMSINLDEARADR